MRIKETVIEIPADHDRIPADHDRMTLELIITDEGVILNTTPPRDRPGFKHSSTKLSNSWNCSLNFSKHAKACGSNFTDSNQLIIFSFSFPVPRVFVVYNPRNNQQHNISCSNDQAFSFPTWDFQKDGYRRECAAAAAAVSYWRAGRNHLFAHNNNRRVPFVGRPLFHATNFGHLGSRVTRPANIIHEVDFGNDRCGVIITASLSSPTC